MQRPGISIGTFIQVSSVMTSGTVYELDSTYSTSKYFNYVVSRKDIETSDPSSIPTPCFDRILSSQKFTKKARDWLYALTGRMLHDVGSMDDWQVALYVYGVASSGKSTYFRIFSEVYEHQDVGVLSDDCEVNFVDQHLIGKHMVMCLDVSGGAQASQNSIQQLGQWRAGHSQSKVQDGNYFELENRPWRSRATGCLLSKSTNGSGTRRFVIFKFDHIVRRVGLDPLREVQTRASAVFDQVCQDVPPQAC